MVSVSFFTHPKARKRSADLIGGHLGAIGEILCRFRIEIPAPSASVRVVSAAGVLMMLVVLVVRMGDHLVRDVLLRMQQLLQTDHGGQDQRQLDEQNRIVKIESVLLVAY